MEQSHNVFVFFVFFFFPGKTHRKLTLNSSAGSGSRARGGDFAQIIAALIASSVIISWDDTLGGGRFTVADVPQPIVHTTGWHNKRPGRSPPKKDFHFDIQHEHLLLLRFSSSAGKIAASLNCFVYSVKSPVVGTVSRGRSCNRRVRKWSQ